MSITTGELNPYIEAGAGKVLKEQLRIKSHVEASKSRMNRFISNIENGPRKINQVDAVKCLLINIKDVEHELLGLRKKLHEDYHYDPVSRTFEAGWETKAERDIQHLTSLVYARYDYDYYVEEWKLLYSLTAGMAEPNWNAVEAFQVYCAKIPGLVYEGTDQFAANIIAEFGGTDQAIAFLTGVTMAKTRSAFHRADGTAGLPPLSEWEKMDLLYHAVVDAIYEDGGFPLSESARVLKKAQSHMWKTRRKEDQYRETEILDTETTKIGDGTGEPLTCLSNVDAGQEFDPVQYFEVKEEYYLALQVLDSLPAQQKRAFYLQKVENLSREEIARRMGCNIESVKTHLKEAQKKLSQLWQENRQNVSGRA